MTNAASPSPPNIAAVAGIDGPFPVLQVALDFLELDRALAVAAEAAAGGADWLEAGTPLIKSEGLEAVRRLRAAFPRHVIVADLKIADAGRLEVEAAAKSGANIVVCLAAASDSTIRQCTEAAARYGVCVACDLLGVIDPVARSREVERLGVNFIGVHLPIDEQMHGRQDFSTLRAVAAAVRLPVAVAGGITTANAAATVENGASIVIVGGAIHKAANAREATAALQQALQERRAFATDLYMRGKDEKEVGEILRRVSAANLSDALHRQPGLRGIVSRTPGRKCVGPAVTVRVAPGDWSKVVQAIDVAAAGSAIVVDAGGSPPAVWGELATRSARQKGIAGVIVDGAVRDTDVAAELGLPIFSRHVCPDAGEPKGYGEINSMIYLSGQAVRPGDWVLADDDGVMILPRHQAVEYANRALDVLETENRLRAEIDAGSTLGQVANLLRWEKR